MSNKINLAPKEIAEYLVSFFQSVGEPLTHLKLQKLLYYIQAWHLVYLDEDIFNEEPEAWVHGPVYRSIYEKYRGVGSSHLFSENYLNPQAKLSSLNLSAEQESQLKGIISHYGVIDAFKLEIMTHAEDPWRMARLGLSESSTSTAKIDMQLAKIYYKNLVLNSKE